MIWIFNLSLSGSLDNLAKSWISTNLLCLLIKCTLIIFSWNRNINEISLSSSSSLYCDILVTIICPIVYAYWKKYEYTFWYMYFMFVLFWSNYFVLFYVNYIRRWEKSMWTFPTLKTKNYLFGWWYFSFFFLIIQI